MPGLSVLFWNLNARPLAPRVGRLVASLNADVVILAECAYSPAMLTRALNRTQTGTFWFASGPSNKLKVFTRLPPGGADLIVREPLDAWLGFRLKVPQVPDLLLYAAHLPSKLWTDPTDDFYTATQLSADIRRSEEAEGHGRTVLIGDLNANPFEPSVVAAGGLHGLMTRQLARRETREVRGTEHPIFYNPMWGFFGDRTPGPAGTYYRLSSQRVNYFWSIFDQVLLRPEVMDRITDLRIVDSDGVDRFVRPDGRPDRKVGSDHLPLYLRLDW